MPLTLSYGKDDPNIAIAVIGVSGSGKSSFINLASGTDGRKVLCGLTVERQEVEVGADFMLDGRSVSLIDTPGHDTFESPATGLMRGLIKACSEIHQRKQTAVHGVVYLHRLANIPPADFKPKLKEFKRLCGGDLKNFIIVPWNDDGSVTSRWIHPEVFEPAVAEGAKIIQYQGTASSAHHILHEICKNHPVLAVPSTVSEKATNGTGTSKDVDRKSGFCSALMCKRPWLSNKTESSG